MANVESVFESYLGYSSTCSYGNFNYSTVTNELYNNRPVILAGYRTSSFGLVYKNGHAWVAEGVKEWVSPETCNTYLYFYLNWGWGGQYNGWFGFSSSEPTPGSNYQYGRKQVTSIKP